MSDKSASPASEPIILEQLPEYRRATARGSALEEHWRDNAFLGVEEQICGVTVRPLTLRIFLRLCAARSPFFMPGPIRPGHIAQFLWHLSPAYDQAQEEKEAARTMIEKASELSRNDLIAMIREHAIAIPLQLGVGRWTLNVGRFLPLCFRRKRTLVRSLQSASGQISGAAFIQARQVFVDSIIHLDYRQARRAIYRYIWRHFMDRPPSKRKRKHEPTAVSVAAAIVHALAKNYSWDDEAILDKPMARLYQYFIELRTEAFRDARKPVPTFNPIVSRLRKRVLARLDARDAC